MFTKCSNAFWLIVMIFCFVVIDIYFPESYKGLYLHAWTLIYILILIFLNQIPIKVKVHKDCNLPVEKVAEHREFALWMLVPCFSISCSIINMAFYREIWINLGIIGYSILAASVFIVLFGFHYIEIIWGLISNVNMISKDNKNNLSNLKTICVDISAQIDKKDIQLIDRIEAKIGKVKMHLGNKIDDCKAFFTGNLRTINFQLSQIETAHGFMYTVDQINQIFDKGIDINQEFWLKNEVEEYWRIMVGSVASITKLNLDAWESDQQKNKHRKYISKQVQHAAMSIVHPELKRILKDNISDVSIQEWQKTYKIMNPDYEIEPLEQAIKLASSDKKPEDKLKSISKILKSMKANQAKGKKM